MAIGSGKGQYTTPEGSRTWEYLVSFFCSVQTLCVGCVLAWSCPSIPKLMAKDSEIPFTASDASTITALLCCGHIISPPLVGICLNRIGRKKTLLLGGLPLALSWIMIIFAKTIMVLFVARFIAGFFLSFATSSISMYIGEISSAKSRGTTGAILGIMVTVGMLITFVVGPYLSIRKMAILCLGLGIVFIMCFTFAPESPYYLAMMGRVEEAQEILEKLRGKHDVSDEMAVILESLPKNDSVERIEIRSKEEDCEVDTDKRTSNKRQTLLGLLFEAVTIPAYRRACLVVMLFVSSSHLSGYSTLISYGQLIFRKMKSPLPEHVVPMVIGLVQLFSSVTMTFAVDRVGRRPIIFVSGILCVLSLIAITLYFYADEYHGIELTEYSMIPLVASMIFVFGLNCGFSGLQPVIISEILATRIKPLAPSIVGILGGATGTSILKIYLMLAVTWGTGHSIPFFGFAIFMAAITITLLHILPETNGKTFVEIQEELSK